MKVKIINAISHVIGWTFFFSLVIAFFSSSPGGENHINHLWKPEFFIFCFIYVLLFYLNFFFITPQFYFKRKYLLYALCTVVLFTAVYFYQPFDKLIRLMPQPDKIQNERVMTDLPPQPLFQEGKKMPGPPPQFSGRKTDINSVIFFIAVWTLSTAIPVIRKWRVAEKKAFQAEADRVNAELSFLKSQINPHFLFNTLNNIYSMAVTKNENTAPSIMKLSNIMRYITDEVRQDFVPLESEIECMRDYIDLQKMRLVDKVTIDLSVIGNITNKKITPLILMTFVENVFKYGTSNHELSHIFIKVTTDENTITFFCQNKIFPNKKNVESTGIGIPNAKKRLEHLYPNKHILDIKKDDNFFTVQLILQS